MRIFVDVGAHYGETLDVALKPAWGFERVFSLEPSEDCQRLLRTFRDPRIHLDNRGLSNETRTAQLHGAGLLGGSVYADKPQGIGGSIETIDLVRAADWLREHTAPEDEVWLKLNCEGSEADVLDDLLASQELARIRSIYVDFDIRKIPSQAHRQGQLEARLAEAGIPYATTETLGAAGNSAISSWLADSLKPVPASLIARVRHALRWYMPPYLRAKAVARLLLPRRVFLWVGGRLGRRSRRGSAN